MWVHHHHELVSRVHLDRVSRLEARGAILTGKHLAEVLDLRKAESPKYLANCLRHCQAWLVEEVGHQLSRKLDLDQ